MKRICLRLFLGLLLILFIPQIAHAASPDGFGPWADSVVTSSQGLRKDGTAVLPARSDPTSALGVAEDDTVDGHFFSLGFGGSLTIGFVNGISSGTVVVEATNLGYPVEKAKVEVSPDGTTWTVAGTVSQDGEVALPQSVTCAKYVRLTDQSNPADFSDTTADAYDVDGVKALGESCTVPTPTPTVTPTPCDEKGCCGSTVVQSNTTVVNTSISQKSNTGKNDANNNTGGDTKVKTGKASNKANVTVTGGSNTADTGNSCCNGGNTNVAILNNGAGSTNKVKIKK